MRPFLEMHRLRGGLQAEHGQLLGAALVLDQAWIIQREAAAQFTLQNSLQLEVIDLAVGADGVLELSGSTWAVLPGSK